MSASQAECRGFESHHPLQPIAGPYCEWVDMIESRTDIQRTHAAEDMIRSVFAMGLSQEEIHQLVTSVAEIEHPQSRMSSTIQVYQTVPPHLCTVPQAAVDHSVTRQAVYQWIAAGLTPVAGLLTKGTAGQPNVTLLDRRQVAAYVESQRVVERVKSYSSDPFVLEELPPGKIDLPTAAKRYDRSASTLHTWVGNDELKTFGRLKGPGHGGGYLILDEAEVASLSRTKPKRTRKHSTKMI